MAWLISLILPNRDKSVVFLLYGAPIWVLECCQVHPAVVIPPCQTQMSYYWLDYKTSEQHLLLQHNFVTCAREIHLQRNSIYLQFKQMMYLIPITAIWIWYGMKFNKLSLEHWHVCQSCITGHCTLSAFDNLLNNENVSHLLMNCIIVYLNIVMHDYLLLSWARYIHSVSLKCIFGGLTMFLHSAWYRSEIRIVIYAEYKLSSLLVWLDCWNEDLCMTMISRHLCMVIVFVLWYNVLWNTRDWLEIKEQLKTSRCFMVSSSSLFVTPPGCLNVRYSSYAVLFLSR